MKKRLKTKELIINEFLKLLSIKTLKKEKEGILWRKEM
jgi:hypothetical protein